MNLNLQRPIVFFDLETTGLQIGSAHIVQISLIKVHPDGHEEQRTEYVRPVDNNGNTVPIPPETTEIHGITNEMVANSPTFKELSQSLYSFIGNADLAGYNSNKFDIPLLVEEFLRAGVDFDIKNRNMVDVQNIFHKMEQRTLIAAYKFYCGKNLKDAHSADADTRATYEVLKAQLDRYDGVDYTDSDGNVSQPVVNDVAKLAKFSTNQAWADLAGYLGYDRQHNIVFNFGKHKGCTLKSVFIKEPSYYSWIQDADFPLSTKKVVAQVWNQMQSERLKNTGKYVIH